MIKTLENPQRNRIMFWYLSYACGMRVCNIWKIQIADVYDEKGKVFDKIVLGKGKTNSTSKQSII